MKVIIFVLALSALAMADELSDCKCKEGYVAEKDETGTVSCYGSILKSKKSILPCNVLSKPPCVCNEDATSVVQDATGTWCGKFDLEGKEDRRWPCENKEEWEAFYKEHPEEKPDYPEKKPELLEEEPEEVKEKPDEPEKKPELLEKEPENLEEKPDQPEKKPELPEEKLESPEQKPEQPEEKP